MANPKRTNTLKSSRYVDNLVTDSFNLNFDYEVTGGALSRMQVNGTPLEEGKQVLGGNFSYTVNNGNTNISFNGIAQNEAVITLVASEIEKIKTEIA